MENNILLVVAVVALLVSAFSVIEANTAKTQAQQAKTELQGKLTGLSTSVESTQADLRGVKNTLQGIPMQTISKIGDLCEIYTPEEGDQFKYSSCTLFCANAKEKTCLMAHHNGDRPFLTNCLRPLNSGSGPLLSCICC